MGHGNRKTGRCNSSVCQFVSPMKEKPTRPGGINSKEENEPVV
jgi:hypothetical protein